MIEWLRIQIIRPIVEILLYIPIPLRYTILIIFFILLLAITPLGVVPRAVAFVITWVFQGMRALLAGIEGLYAHKHFASSTLRAFDPFIDMLLFQLSRAVNKLQHIRQLPLHGWRPRRRLVFLLAVVPLALWFIALPLRATALGRAINTGYAQVG